MSEEKFKKCLIELGFAGDVSKLEDIYYELYNIAFECGYNSGYNDCYYDCRDYGID